MNISTDPYSFMAECRRDALYTATKQVMVKYFRAKIEKGDLDEQVWNLDSEFSDMLTYLKDVKKQKILPTSRKYLISVSPPDDSDVTWDSLLKVYLRLKEYKDVLHESKMVLEQRSEDPEHPYGYHMHIATTNAHGLTKSALITRTLLALKNVTGLKERTYITVTANPNAYDYVLGEKTDTKKEKMKADKILRKNNNYLDIY